MPSRCPTKRWPLVLSTVIALAGPACGDPPCGPEVELTAGSPQVESFSLLQQQNRIDPWTLLLRVDFKDSDGDLSGGEAQFFVNDSTSKAVQPMRDLYRASAVSPGATEGSVWASIRLVSEVPDGAKATLAVQLVDKAGNKSNCYSLELRFERQNVATRVVCSPSRRG